jgi:hypothetical protein
MARPFVSPALATATTASPNGIRHPSFKGKRAPQCAFLLVLMETESPTTDESPLLRGVKPTVVAAKQRGCARKGEEEQLQRCGVEVAVPRPGHAPAAAVRSRHDLERCIHISSPVPAANRNHASHAFLRAQFLGERANRHDARDIRGGVHDPRRHHGRRPTLKLPTSRRLTLR